MLYSPDALTPGVEPEFGHHGGRAVTATPFYREAGAGEAVICLHSSASGSGQWRALMERLGNRYRLIAPDLLGYGRNPALPGDRSVRLADEVAALESVFDRAGRLFSLIGHSFGGAIALKAALQYRDRLRCLIIYEPTLFSLLVNHLPDHAATAEITAVAGDTIRAVEQGDLAGAAERFVDYWVGPGTWAATPESRRPAIMQGMRKVVLEWPAAFREPTTLAEFASLDFPTLYLIGSTSPASVRTVAELLAPVLPQAEVVELSGVGHMGPVTHPEVVNPIIERFLARALDA